MNWRSVAETLTITLAAMATSLVLFGLFMLLMAGVPPSRLYTEMFVGGFGTRFSWQNTLTRAAPLILTALCTALPARLGLIVIGGEGALILGGLAAVSAGLLLQGSPVLAIQLAMLLAGMLAGGLLIAFVGALRDRRGVNETIASLLVTYIAIGVFSFLVEGPMRDPASLNKPSTYPIANEVTIGKMGRWIGEAVLPSLREATPRIAALVEGLSGFLDVHWGLAFGVIYCLIAYIVLDHTTFGFAARMVGGNVRAAQAAGLPVGRLILIACLLGGGAAGLAGAVEIAAVHRQANASLIAGYGFTGILVSFIARHHPLGIIPAAILFGGLGASSGVLQRRLHVPDASVQVLMGIMFVMILLFDTLYGRFRVFQPRLELTSPAEEHPQPAPPSMPRSEPQEALVP
jgi:simple sugar transport system permease protein